MRVVLDTGVVLSALLFPEGRLRWLLDAWRSQRLVPHVSTETAAELIRALAYPKFGLDEGEIQILLGDYLPHAEVVDTIAAENLVDLPRCRDPDDQIFLALTATARADALVTGDRALLELASRAPFQILTAAELKKAHTEGR